MGKYCHEQGSLIGASDTEAPTEEGFLDPGNIVQATPVTVGTGFAISMTNETGEDIVYWGCRTKKFNSSVNSIKSGFLASTYEEVSAENLSATLLEFMGLEDGGVYFVQLHFLSESAPRRYAPPVIIRCVAEVVAA